MKESVIYKISRFFAFLISKFLLKAKFIGIENIPKFGKVILAGNHINNLDCFLVVSSTKRCVHFLAKDELMKGVIKKFYFKEMGIIPVNRKIKDKSVIPVSKKELEKDRCICIFPEGTTEKSRGLMDFKIGAVKIAYDTKAPIIPFAIKGNYRFFSNDLEIVFEKPIYITNENLDEENQKLKNEINNILER